MKRVYCDRCMSDCGQGGVYRLDLTEVRGALAPPDVSRDLCAYCAAWIRQASTCEDVREEAAR